MIYRLPHEYDASTLAAITGGRLIGINAAVSQLTLDSRDKNPNGLFIAVKGERFDGHDFISGAVENGASLVICQRQAETTAAQLVVSDTIEALGKIGAAVRTELSPIVVAVTGSVGKTTTKQLIYSILSEKYPTHKTEGNLNNLIGLPLSLLGLRPEHKAAVFEFGMSARGEISRLSRLAAPDAAVITNIGSSHLEFLHTRENIRDAKLEIRDGLKAGGTLILNADEPLLAGIEGARYVSLSSTADVYVDEWHIENMGIIADIAVRDELYKGLYIPAVGGHIAYDAAVAVAAADSVGVGEDEIRRGLAAFRNTGMRQNIFDMELKCGKVRVIDDCYNASPESMWAALDVLCGAANGNGIAVLGDMRELGVQSAALHRGVGEYAAKMGVKALFAFGADAALIAEGAKENGCREAFVFADLGDPDTIAAALREYVKAGDTLLFKASRAVEMERVMNRLRV